MMALKVCSLVQGDPRDSTDSRAPLGWEVCFVLKNCSYSRQRGFLKVNKRLLVHVVNKMSTCHFYMPVNWVASKLSGQKAQG